MTSTQQALRTPDERFADLPGWSYAPHYVDDLPGYEGLRMHYVDEGPKDADTTFLCLHGEPSWSYLYRRMEPLFTGAGARVIAPDFFGFGRSDKPVEDETYTFEFHRNAMLALIEKLDIQNVCLVCQDWGGLIGLTLPMDASDRFTRMIVMNTALGLGLGLGEGFKAWRAFAASNPDLDVGQLIKRGTPHLTDAEVAAYNAPFPDVTYKAGVRQFPQIVPDSPEAPGADISRRAAKFLSEEWSGDSFMAIGMQDPVLGPQAMEFLRGTIRNCRRRWRSPMGVILFRNGARTLQRRRSPISAFERV